MTELNETLPLLPLTSGVALPGMVFTMALETDEARAAVEAAGSSNGRLLLVPHIDGRYSSIGAIAEIVEVSDLDEGPRTTVVHAIERARIGSAVPSTGRTLWVQVERIRSGEPSAAARELAREYRAVVENILLSRGARRFAEQLREVTDPG